MYAVYSEPCSASFPVLQAINREKFSKIDQKIPDQIIINEYQSGQGISAHIDCVSCFEETIASLSLGSPCIMEFSHTRTQQKIPLLLEPRSLIILSGDARYHWQHALPVRKTDRHEGLVILNTIHIGFCIPNLILLVDVFCYWISYPALEIQFVSSRCKIFFAWSGDHFALLLECHSRAMASKVCSLFSFAMRLATCLSCDGSFPDTTSFLAS